MNKVFIVGLIMFTCFNIRANASLDNNGTPFGLTWGMSLDELKSKLTDKYEIDAQEERCPLIRMTTQSVPNKIDEPVEYELNFLPKYKQLNFSGLVSAGFYYSTLSETSYRSLLDKLHNELTNNYGEPQQLAMTKADQEHYIYKSDEIEVSLFVMKRNNNYSIAIDYSYFPKNQQVALRQNMHVITEECIKQRSSSM